MKYNPNTMSIVCDGKYHAIVEVDTGLLTPTGQKCTKYGVLVKKSNKIWHNQLYWGYSGDSFVQARFDKLEYQADYLARVDIKGMTDCLDFHRP